MALIGNPGHLLVLFLLFVTINESIASELSTVDVPADGFTSFEIDGPTSVDIDGVIRSYNGTVISRRLFSISSAFSSVSGALSKAGTTLGAASSWVAKTASSVGVAIGNALGLDKVVEVLTQGKQYVLDGVDVAKTTWEGMKSMVGELLKIYMNFEPLKAVFGDKNGLELLLTSPNHIHRLVQTIQGLLGTSGVLRVLSDALTKAGDMFKRISDFFGTLLHDVTGARRRLESSDADASEIAQWHATERRLLDFTSLLKGLDFTKIMTYFTDFVRQVSSFATTLTSLNTTFGAALSTVDHLVTGARRLHSVGGRRLDLMKDSARYSDAIKKVVPTWQGLESLAITMCPIVLGSKGSSDSLSCRVQGFIDKSSHGNLMGAISGLVTGCTEDPMATSKGTSTSHGCPTTSNSAGISDLIGENANMLGLILAIVGAAVVFCGGGGAAAVGLLKSGGDDEDDSEDEEAALVDSADES